MIDEKKYRELKKGIELLEREVTEATGALKQLKKQLKKDFKCNSLKEAKQLLAKLEKEEEKHEKEFNKAFKKFKREHGPAVKALSRGDQQWYILIPGGSVKLGSRAEAVKAAKKRTKSR